MYPYDEPYLKIYDRISELKLTDPIEIIIPEDKLYYDLGLDSLDFVELVLWCEETFDIELPDQLFPIDIQTMTLKDFVGTVETQLED